MKRIFFGVAILVAFLTFTSIAQTAKSKSEPLAVGATAPDFTLSDSNGKSVTLSTVKQPTVLVFYRGYW